MQTFDKSFVLLSKV